MSGRSLTVFTLSLFASAAAAQRAPLPASATPPVEVVETDAVQSPREFGGPKKPVAVLPSARLFGGAPSPSLRLPVAPPDVERLRREDERPDPTGRKCHRVGVALPLAHDPAAPTTFVPLADAPGGGRYWSAEITAPGAVALRLRFTQFHLPEGAEIHVHSGIGEPGAVEFPPFRGDGIDGTGEFWSQTVVGDRAIVEYVEAKSPLPGSAGADDGKLPFRIESVLYVYRDGDDTDHSSHLLGGACELDATCFPGWANEGDAVGRMSFVDGGLGWVCTGTLLNSQNGDLTPYFLTANHCIANNTVAGTLEVAWFFETPTCDGTPPAISSVPRSLGSTFLNGRDASVNDFTLLMINGGLPGGLWWAGWTTAALEVGEFVAGLHHPNGTFRRFSYGRIQESCWSANYHCVGWVLGVTEGGSSGSALFDLDRRVVGQLRGGDSSCANPAGIDDYGAFAVTYPMISSFLAGGTDDGYENNDSCAAAWPLAEGWIFSRILRSTDPDWFRVNVPPLSRVTISLSFTHANGDIDVVLYDGCGGPLVSSSTGVTDSETVRFDNLSFWARTVYLNPYLYSDTRNEYSINVTTTPCGAEDVLEPNDTCAEAWPIPNSGSGAPSVSKADPDWFLISIPPYSTLDIGASFTHAVADVDMIAYEPCTGAIYGSSTGTGNSEFVSVTNPGGTVRDVALNVYVYSLGAGDCNVYTLTRVVTLCTSEDILEDNDTCATASPIAIGHSGTLVSGPGDDDYLAFTVPAGATVRTDLFFTHARGDVDEYLWDASCTTLLGFSTGTTDSETIVWRNTGPDADVILGVTLYSGNCNEYALSVSATPNAGPFVATPSGASTAYETETVALTTWGVDPEGDDVTVVIAWGDGTVSSSDPVPSGTEVTLTHEYLADGVYAAIATSYDVFGATGGDSDQHLVEVLDVDDRAGNVNADATGIPVNVLRVNGSVGAGAGRVVTVSSAAPIGVALGAAPAGPNPGRYAVWVFPEPPVAGSGIDVRFGLGRMAMDPFTTTCGPCPIYAAATLAYPCGLAPCSTAEATGRLAPGTVLSIPAGRLAPGTRLFVQGILRDNSDTTSSKRASVTNGVEVIVAD